MTEKEAQKQQDEKIDETDKCYLIYNEDGYLTCSYCHKAGAKCLMKLEEKITNLINNYEHKTKTN